MSEEYVQYSCTSDEADPTPLMKVTVTDQNGDDVIVNMETGVKTIDGVGNKVVFGVIFNHDMTKAEIECKSENEVGQAMNRITTQVQCKFAFF